MKIRHILLLLLCSFLFMRGPATSYASPVEPLFTPGGNTLFQQSYMERSQQITFHEDVMQHGAFTLPIFGTTYTAQITKTHPGNTVGGHLVGYEGSTIYMSVTDGVAFAEIYVNGEYYTLRYNGYSHYLAEMPAPNFFNDAILPPGSELSLEGLGGPATETEAVPASYEPSNTTPEITVMVVHTVAARNVLGGTAGVQSAVNTAVAYTNDAYANSGINGTIRLVHIYESPDYVEPNLTGYDAFSTANSEITDPTDGKLDEIHAIRDEYAADFVAFIPDLDASVVCGVGWLNLAPWSTDSARWAFSTDAASCFGGTVFAHEIGHNMGMHHDWYVENSVEPYPYGKGYVDTEAGFLTIMAYYNECADLNIACKGIQHFSNPDVLYEGRPTGSTDPNTPADNARLANQHFVTFSQFRTGGKPIDGEEGRTLYVDADATGANDGTSWADAYTTVQTALLNASFGDEVWVAEGVYYPDEGEFQTDNDINSHFKVNSQVAIYGGFAGTETERTQRDPSANITVLSGDLTQNDTTDANGIVTDPANIVGDNALNVLKSTNADKTAIIDGFTITGAYGVDSGGGMYNEDSSPTLTNVTFVGNTSTGDSFFSSGGAMFNYRSSPTLTNVTFMANTTPDFGGGIYNYESSPTLLDSTFMNNSAEGDGGGIYNYESTVTLKGVTFTANTTEGGGGGIYSWNSTISVADSTFDSNTAGFSGGGLGGFDTKVVINNTTFTANSAGSGGGAYNSGENQTTTIEGSTFEGNTAGTGGGLYNSTTDLILKASTFTGNTATNSGGGVYTYSSAAITLNDVTFEANTADGSGGGFADFQSTGLTLENVSFTGNTANSGGGAATFESTVSYVNVVFNGNEGTNSAGGMYNSDSTLALTNATFYANTSGYSGALYNTQSTVAIQNSLFWQNTAPTGPLMVNDNTTVTIGYSMYDETQIANFSESTVTPGMGNVTDGSDPLFVDADGADDTAGNADDDLTLQLVSPALDTGNNAADLDGSGDGTATISDVATDRSGVARIFDGDENDEATVDRGAYEYVVLPDGDPVDASGFYFAAPHAIDITWTDAATNETGYIIERKKAGATDWKTLITTAADATSYTDDTVTCDQDYVYRVTATNKGANGTPIETDVVTTICNIFVDVPAPNQPPFFEEWVEDFYKAGVTLGCNDGEAGVDLEYCPTLPVNRGSMAVFLLRAMSYPDDYMATGADPNPFVDVPSPNLPPFFEQWIEDFYALGITTGCNGGTEGVDLEFCPDVNVTRGQMAVFILRALEGEEYVPVNDPKDPFVDIPGQNLPPTFEAWIEDFYNRGITTGCNSGEPGVDLKFCPDTVVDRGQMAVFILRAFDNIPDPNDP